MLVSESRCEEVEQGGHGDESNRLERTAMEKDCQGTSMDPAGARAGARQC